MVSLIYSDRRCIGNISGLALRNVRMLLGRRRGRRHGRSILKRSVFFTLIKSEDASFLYGACVFRKMVNEKEQSLLESCFIFFFCLIVSEGPKLPKLNIKFFLLFTIIIIINQIYQNGNLYVALCLYSLIVFYYFLLVPVAHLW